MEKKGWRQLQKNATSNIEQVLEATLHKADAVWQPTTYHEKYQSERICRKRWTIGMGD